MKKKLIRIMLLVLGSIIGLLGVGIKCINSNNDHGSSYPMYGVPSATYILDGTVVNKAMLSSAINGIQIESNSNKVLSGTNGTWNIDWYSSQRDILNYTIIATDIDGTQNGGLFLTTTVSGTFLVEDPVSSDSSWDTSRFTAHNIIIEMSKSN